VHRKALRQVGVSSPCGLEFRGVGMRDYEECTFSHGALPDGGLLVVSYASALQISRRLRLTVWVFASVSVWFVGTLP
jgi:hypothetical protein